ncbi:MAG: polyphosphate--glucose phosphotransferase [Thermodesulfobacteriota bacterium]
MEKKPVKLKSVVLGIDIGGTGIKSAPVDIDKGILLEERYRIDTPHPASPKSMLAAIKGIIAHWKWEGALGCGFPGVMKSGEVYTAANLSKKWISVNIRNDIEKISPCRVVVINDADSAGLAEMKFGAGEKYNKHDGGVVLMITLGTGIGSALFVDGHLVRNTEFGHIEIDGQDAEKRAAEIHREIEGLSWKKWGKRVNKYLLHIEKLLSPDLIIIGGGISKKSDKFFPYLNTRAKIIPAKMLNDAGIIGAALASEL